MRLFVSIDFSETVLKEIRSWIPKQEGWKKALIHQMHLTLVFLGDCSDEEMEEVNRKLSEIEFTPFEMTIGGLEHFQTNRHQESFGLGFGKMTNL